jgi:hypothetical protein
VESALFGLLTLVSLALAFVCATFAGVYVRRLQGRAPNAVGEQIGSAKVVTHKVAKRQAMSPDELEYANHLIRARSSLMTFFIPATLFALGCFYIFGSLYHLHGATPSERTFLGVFPILASIAQTTQILRHVRLKSRLRRIA